jgi:hypothetical protein
MNRLAIGTAAALALFAGSAAQAQFFGSGGLRNVVVSQISNGGSPLSNAANQTSLIEYTRAGTATGQSVAFNGTGSGIKLTNSGTAGSEGYLSSTLDGRYILNAGYNAVLGTGAVASTTAAAAPRVIGITDTWTGAVTYSAFDSSVFSGNNIRSAAASIDGSGAITNVFGAGAANGIRQTTVAGGTGGTQIGGAAPTNFRNVKVFNFGAGDLVFASNNSTTAGALSGVNLIGATTTTSIIGNTTGFGQIASNNVYDFFFANDRVLYLADERATGTGSGLTKLVRTGGTAGNVASGAWAISYSITGAGLRGLTGEVVGNTVNLFGVTNEAANRLVSYSDTLTNTTAGSLTTLATAGTNTIFRGVTIIPTPGAVALVGLGGLLAARRRRA